MGYTDGKLLGSDEGIKLVSNDGKVLGTIPGNVDGITLGLDIGTELGFLDGSFDGSNEGKLEGLLLGDSLGSTYGKLLCYDEGTTRSGLTWLGVHVVFVGCMFDRVGCHATSKGAELSCELDDILVVDIIREVSSFHGNIHILWILSAFLGNIHILWILSALRGYIFITWILSASRGNIYVL